jgi:hypothetical protein
LIDSLFSLLSVEADVAGCTLLPEPVPDNFGRFGPDSAAAPPESLPPAASSSARLTTPQESVVCTRMSEIGGKVELVKF